MRIAYQKRTQFINEMMGDLHHSLLVSVYQINKLESYGYKKALPDIMTFMLDCPVYNVL